MPQPLLGKDKLIKVLYGTQTYSFRITDWDESDGSELRARDYVGRTTSEGDTVHGHYSGSMTVLFDGPTIDLIVKDQKARDKARLPPQPMKMTVTNLYRDGATAPGADTYTNFQWTVDQKVQGRKADVTRGIKWMADEKL